MSEIIKKRLQENLEIPFKVILHLFLARRTFLIKNNVHF